MFKVGDKVVCIDNNDLDSRINEHASKLKLNKIYIAEKCSMNFIKINGINFNYLTKRFILLTDYRKMKINKICSMLAKK